MKEETKRYVYKCDDAWRELQNEDGETIWYETEYWMKIYSYINMITWVYHINIALTWSICDTTIYSGKFDKEITDIDKLKKKLDSKLEYIDEFLETIKR